MGAEAQRELKHCYKLLILACATTSVAKYEKKKKKKTWKCERVTQALME